jgi:hypothetical protein
VAVSGSSNHLLVSLQVERDENKPPRPFKFNPKLLKDEEFTILVRHKWKKFDPTNGNIAMFKFLRYPFWYYLRRSSH